jgi:hypothetical protein
LTVAVAWDQSEAFAGKNCFLSLRTNFFLFYFSPDFSKTVIGIRGALATRLYEAHLFFL